MLPAVTTRRAIHRIRIIVMLLGLLTLLIGASRAMAGGRRGQRRQSATASAHKFQRVQQFSTRLPGLRNQVSATLSHPRLDRRTAVAAIVRIMDTTYMRVGSERYARRTTPGKKSRGPTFGASSLRKQHVRVQGNHVTFTFPGKSGVHWRRTVNDPQLARVVQMFLQQPGERLFQVKGRGSTMSAVSASHVRSLLSGYGAKPKDFRTLHANRLLEQELSRLPAPTSRTQAEANLRTAIPRVARQLGHTPSVCKSSYLDGTRLDSYATNLR